MMTHTKGPWKWVDEYDGTDADFSRMDSATLVNSEGQGVVFYADFDSATFGSMEMAKANARLIAAAPDLLEALNGIEEYLDHTYFCEQRLGGDVCDCNLNGRHDMVLAAIAKAKGQTYDAETGVTT